MSNKEIVNTEYTKYRGTLLTIPTRIFIVETRDKTRYLFKVMHIGTTDRIFAFSHRYYIEEDRYQFKNYQLPQSVKELVKSKGQLMYTAKGEEIRGARKNADMTESERSAV